MRRLVDMNCSAEYAGLLAYGTSEGATRAWDTRGRGRKEQELHTLLKSRGWRRWPKWQMNPTASSNARLVGYSSVYGKGTHTIGIHPDGTWEHDPLGLGSMGRIKGKDAQSLSKHLDRLDRKE